MSAGTGGGGGGTVAAPGRVNLIGDHTDYNDGFVLPAALDLRCRVAWQPRVGDALRLRSRELTGEALLPIDGSGTATGWARTPAAVLAELHELGIRPPAIDATIESTVPLGAGLSSSAALEVALACALLDAAGESLDMLELARLAQRAEQRATGVPCGIMDQLASVAGVAGHALLIDCRSLDVRPVPIPDSVGLAIVDSGQRRTLEGSEYARRRAACEQAARRLGVSHLRDAQLEDVAHDPFARHVVRENARVLAAVDALAAGDVGRLGELFLGSHASLRDDYAVSTPELDGLVAALVDEGAEGARLTGAGFGGCVVAVGDPGRLDAAVEAAMRRHGEATGLQPQAWRVHASDGALR